MPVARSSAATHAAEGAAAAVAGADRNVGVAAKDMLEGRCPPPPWVLKERMGK
jgi:hypothetical protein